VDQCFSSGRLIQSKLFITTLVVLWILAFMPFAKAESIANSASQKAIDIHVKTVIGGLEAVSVLPHALQFNAKVDTGAKNSSMHATDIDFYLQGKQEYVRFKTVDSNGESSMIELPLLRKVRIKRHGGKSLSRAVVMVGVCLGSVYKVVQVTLIDRSRFKFPFLIGASFLKDDFLVDVSKRFTSKANCNSVTGAQ